MSSIRGSLDVTSDLLSSLASVLGMTSPRISYLAGDGSDRSYYRIADAGGVGKAVLMYLSESDASLLAHGRYDWIHIRKTFAAAGLPVPQIIAKMPERRLLVIEDCGDETLEMAVRNAPTPLDRLAPYQVPLNHIAQMLQVPANSHEVWTSRSFDYEKLHFELMFFHEHYVCGFMKKSGLSVEDVSSLMADYESLARWLASKSQYLTHRDYHSRNILVDKGRYSLIDFQDARVGPASYDMVSLIFDPYVTLTLKERFTLLEQGQNIVGAKSEGAKSALLDSWKPCALQRLIKALGSFAYLTQVKNRGDYLSYAPRTISLLKEISLEDSRWPFLSGRFLELAASHLADLDSHA